MNIRIRRIRRVPSAFAGLALASLLGAACGSRGPLDDSFVAPGSLDAGLDSAPPVPLPTAPVDAAPDAPVGPDFPPIVDCGICLATECGQPILSCVTNPSCQRAFQCVLSSCGASLDTTCILGCARTEPQGALQLLSIFQCVTGQCGADCVDLLSQLGGGLPGIPGTPPRDGGAPPPPPPPRDAGPRQPNQPNLPTPDGFGGRVALERAFSAWPELLTPNTPNTPSTPAR